MKVQSVALILAVVSSTFAVQSEPAPTPAPVNAGAYGQPSQNGTAGGAPPHPNIEITDDVNAPFCDEIIPGFSPIAYGYGNGTTATPSSSGSNNGTDAGGKDDASAPTPIAGGDDQKSEDKDAEDKDVGTPNAPAYETDPSFQATNGAEGFSQKIASLASLSAVSVAMLFI
ncbi:hypothetical protein MIR68_006325 [Amoeboaphelidium protococcarum]|nr:hypothetical protein MIR68_006325 [Amoeboaphelidium protococcarum]